MFCVDLKVVGVLLELQGAEEVTQNFYVFYICETAMLEVNIG